MRKRIGIVVICMIAISAFLCGTAFAGSSSVYGDDEITLGKIPAKFTVNIDNNNLFVKGLLEEEQVSISRAGTSVEEVTDLLKEADTEALIIPEGYTLADTPVYIFVFVTDGYTNQYARLSRLDAAGIQYLSGLIVDLYSEDEQPKFTAVDVGNERYIICDRVSVDDDGNVLRQVRDYYNVWNGDLIQVMVAFNEEDREAAIKWVEDFLETWTEAE